MILGTQWYILFNVIVGTTALPPELQLAAQQSRRRRWLWWRRVILPAIFPAYVTGAVTAAGGSWNASIVSEVVQWGDTTLTRDRDRRLHRPHTPPRATAPASRSGSACCASMFSPSTGCLWRRLYDLAAERLRLD